MALDYIHNLRVAHRVIHRFAGKGLTGMTDIRTIEQVVGDNMRRLRGRQSQAEFGQRLGQLLGKPWSAQVVSAAESGKRSFIAAEMVALCTVFGCTIRDLYRVDGEVNVRITDDLTIPAVGLQMMAAGVSDESLQSFLWTMLPQLKGMQLTLRAMEEELKQSQRGLAEASVRLSLITDYWAESITSPVEPPPDALDTIERFAQQPYTTSDRGKDDFESDAFDAPAGSSQAGRGNDA